MFSFFEFGEVRDPIITKEILSSLTQKQNEMLEQGRMIYNPISGDLIVPINVQGTIARVIINLL
jgi:hypothetical protein